MTIRKFENFTPDIHDSAYIDETALVVGDVVIGADSSIWPMTAVRGDVNSIRIGKRTNIQDGSILHVTHDGEFAPGGFELTVGDNVTVGHGVILHACTVGNFSLVGMGATVLDGAIIEDFAMVGAGSLVSPGKIIESGYLWLGAPARKVRELTDKEKKWLAYSADHYVNLKDRHRKC
ncbi:MAG: gamma carbonic anhydrase family protein [Gammaproteobacteria bacterium]|nr:gamma carbonic anhydrase family protein [Gammaproteobacteria bacterium]MDH5593315.1 gamma carbonic anhydrase family protein [Gammaproteobacteria bacterium]MDH5614551.1 gamma carbonic anhydrase family protein [Gammaproteobacteria bacterium]